MVVRKLDRELVHEISRRLNSMHLNPFYFMFCSSEVVVRELEREMVDKARRSRAETFMARALECFDAGVAFVDASQPEWRALHCSSAFTKVCDTSRVESFCCTYHLTSSCCAAVDLLQGNTCKLLCRRSVQLMQLQRQTDDVTVLFTQPCAVSCQVTGITTAAARAAPLWQLLCPPGGCAAGGPGAASWAAACAVMAGHRREFMLPGLMIHGRPELGAFTLRFRCALAVSIHKDSISCLIVSLGPTIHGRPERGAFTLRFR